VKILLLDIENSPEGAWLFQPKRVKYLGPANMREDGLLLCFAAKWLDSPKIFFHSIRHDGKQGMLDAAWKLLDEADVVVHYYGRRHDIPILNREFLLAGMPPPSPYKQVDLYYAIRNFGFPFNGLDYVSKRMGYTGKTLKLSIPLLVACANGEEWAWRKIRPYNKQDVRLLEFLYYRLQPWIRNHPSHGAHEGADVCPACSSEDLEHRGYSMTNSGKYQRYRCLVCGKWSRSNKRVSGTQIVEAA
jgi:hypothetical protein